MRCAVICCALTTGLLFAATQPQFADKTAELDFEPGGGAVCWVDLDNDGWVDLCCGGVAWRNQEGKAFTRITNGLGPVVAADIDNDGFDDLFSWSARRVYRNESGRAFKPMSMPELPASASCAACLGDFNGDGFVDVYVGGYENWGKGITYPDMLLINDKGRGFTHRWSDKRYRARGVTACDMDRDGDLDVYVSNYRLQPNVLWLNDGAGSLRDVAAAQRAVATSGHFGGGHSIGAAWGDFDNDGWIDLFAGNFAHRDGRGNQPQSRFLRNLRSEGKAAFEDLGICGVFYQESYACPAAGDYDNDGDLDLFFTTIYGVASFNRKNSAVLYCNEGGFAFKDATTAVGLAGIVKTYQAAWADYDNDGDLDLVAGGRLHENQGTRNHWLKVRLRGDGKRVNRSAVGAQVRLMLGEKALTRQVEAGTGQGNQNDICLHFGLGEHTEPVNLNILWPGGHTQAVESVKVDQCIDVMYEEAGRYALADLETKVLAAKPGRYYGRCAIQELPDGSWFLVYHESGHHWAYEPKRPKPVLGGVLHARFSRDGGATWSKEDHCLDGTPVAGFPAFPPGAEPDNNAFEPGEPWAYLAPNGDLVVHSLKDNFNTKRWDGTWQMRSSDGGKTWSALTKIDFDGIENDGDIWAIDDHFIVDGVIYMGAREIRNRLKEKRNLLVRSADNGHTWRFVSYVTDRMDTTTEQGIEYLGGKTILCVLNSVDKRHTYQTLSRDMGKTWEPLRDIAAQTGIWDRPRIFTAAHLRGEEDWWKDRVILGASDRRTTPGKSMPRQNCLWGSPDAGETWQMMPLDEETGDSGYGDMVYDKARDRYVAVLYHGTVDEAVLKQYSFRLEKE